jgi:hypothetical protein
VILKISGESIRENPEKKLEKIQLFCIEAYRMLNSKATLKS